MASSVLEAQRSALEELDRIEQAIADRISRNPGLLPDNAQLSTSTELHGRRKRPLKETALQQQEIGRFIKRYKEQAEFLFKSYTPPDKEANNDQTVRDALLASHPAAVRKAELTAISTTSDARVSLLDNFYQQVSEIKEYHRKYPNQEVESLETQYQMGIVTLRKQREQLENGVFSTSSAAFDFADDEIGNEQSVAVANLLAAESKGTAILLSSMAVDLNLDSIFSGEEFYGKYLDLVAFHERFVNLKFISSSSTFRLLSYIQFLEAFTSYSDVSLFPKSRLSDDDYFAYATELHKYIESAFSKIHVLENTTTVISKIEADFETNWEKKTSFPDWSFETKNIGTSTKDGIETPEGFYCTPCGKHFAKETVYNSHLTGKKHIKNAKKQGSSSSSAQNTDSATQELKLRLLAFHEYCTYQLVELLQKQLTDTKNNIERRRALTDRERKLELDALEAEDTALLAEIDPNDKSHRRGADGSNANGGGDDDDEDEDDVVYNPLKLPLGWDGKPIPFWLWKLHGLGVEYPCEICGNQVYMGRKLFEKHFMEARHVHGLRCLGVVPSLLFKGVTSIKDAMALWDKIKRENRQRESQRENAIEMEDDEGNVMSEKVYNDLKKQGLL